MLKTIVVNKYKEKYDVYIGRPSSFGNPFAIGKDGTRDEVIDKFEDYFHNRLQTDDSFKKEVLSLSGLKLGCFCKPLRCHGDVIAEYLNGLVDQRKSHLTQNQGVAGSNPA